MSLWEKILEMSGAFISQIVSVKEDYCSFERLASECIISQKLKSPEVIGGTDVYKNVRNIGPMVAQIDKKSFRPKEMQPRLYVIKHQRWESSRSCQKRNRYWYIGAKST
jgi:hypothetical protein